jgi:hypothetical protein
MNCKHRDRNKSSAKSGRFNADVESRRVLAARGAFGRATIAGALRHLAIDQGNFRAAVALGNVKQQAAARALELAPELVVVQDASDDPRLLSISFKGVGRLHLPPEFEADQDLRKA